MKIKVFSLACILLVACSCEQATYDNPIKHFSKVRSEKLIHTKRVDLETYGVYRPWDVVKKGDSYYVYDYSSRDKSFCQINQNSGIFRSGVSIGSGPGELQMIERLLVEGDEVTVYDGVHRKRYRIIENVDSILKVEEYKNVEVDLISYPTFWGERMATKGFTGENWIRLYNGNKEVGTGRFPYFPETNRLSSQEKVSVFRNGQQKFSPDGSKLAVCISNGCAIAMYDCNDVSLEERMMWEYFPPVFSLANYEYQKTALSLKSKAGFLDVACTNEYVFALYSGKTLSDGLSTAYYGNHVFVYDWDGFPCKHYVLDKELFVFNIDIENNILYGVSNDPEGCILEYKL